MKTKPILIALACIVLLAGVVLFFKFSNSNKSNKKEIYTFLSAFNAQLKTGDKDSILAYFEKGKNRKAASALIDILTGRTAAGKIEPLFNISLDVENSVIRLFNKGYAAAKVNVTFTRDGFDTKKSSLSCSIFKNKNGAYKIYKVTAITFLADYYAYKTIVLNSTAPEKETYSPITLAAFKTAEKLKTRYDSVIWFAHINQKTFFYVVKGKWSMYKDIEHPKDSVIEPYKMGLVNPELKEIIPVEYDLIHNINGTIQGLVEVEKDNKKGFYTLYGKNVVPVRYDQIFPITDDANLAVLRNGDDYFYLKNDTTISEKANIKIADFFPKIKNLTNSYDLYKNALSVVTEYNSREDNQAIYISPSYLVDMNMIVKQEDFENPLRSGIAEDLAHKNFEVKFAGKSSGAENWLEACFYSVRDYFLGGRTEFYDSKNIVILDKKRDRIFTKDIGIDYSRSEEGEGDGSVALGGICDVNSIKTLSDSLFEVKSGAVLDFELYDSTKYIAGGPYYHYLAIKDNKLVELPNKRNFGFTKYVKMDDSYLNACYNLITGTERYKNPSKKTLDYITPEMLRYMKNEIFADYKYQFKDKRWANVFAVRAPYDSEGNEIKPVYNVTVDDSLTEIDKYNINWITQKLNGKKSISNRIAAK